MTRRSTAWFCTEKSKCIKVRLYSDHLPVTACRIKTFMYLRNVISPFDYYISSAFELAKYTQYICLRSYTNPNIVCITRCYTYLVILYTIAYLLLNLWVHVSLIINTYRVCRLYSIPSEVMAINQQLTFWFEDMQKAIFGSPVELA